MPENTFERYQESRTSFRWVVGGGVAVLVIALVAALAAALIALNREPEEEPVERTPVAAPEQAEDLIGTYSGEFVQEGEQPWPGVVALTGSHGILAYPQRGCEVFLSQPEVEDNRVSFESEALNRKCQAGGQWVFEGSPEGLKASYESNSQVIVNAELQPEA